MKLKRNLKVASGIFAVLTALGVIALVAFPANAMLVKIGTIVALFSIIGIIACVRALGEINWRAYEGTRKISDVENKYRSMTNDWM